MAFMGLFMMYMMIVLIILGVSAFTCALCFIISGIIMVIKRRKNKDEKVKTPWYVIALRVIGAIAALPIVGFVFLMISASIGNEYDKKTNLERAVMSYDYEMAEEILSNGADPDVYDENGNTLLICLIGNSAYSSPDGGRYYKLDNRSDEDDIRMIEILLNHGADINAKKKDCGNDDGHIAGDEGWNGIYANSDHPCGNTPILYAVKYRSPEIVEFLIDNGASINTPNACGFTPILMCADNRSDEDGGLEIMEQLIKAGADPWAQSNFQQDIIWLLSRQANYGNVKMEKLVMTRLGG